MAPAPCPISSLRRVVGLPSRRGRRRGPAPSRRTLLLFGLLGLLAVGLGADPAAAHGRSVSYSSWVLDADGAEVELRLALLELSRLGPEALPPGTLADDPAPGRPDLAAHVFPDQLGLLADDARCEPAGPARRRPDQPGWVRYAWRVDCPVSAARLEIASRLLLDVAPGHMHFVRVRDRDASAGLREQVLTEGAPRFVVRDVGGDVEARDAVAQRFRDYLTLGVEHILTGWDHLAFVFGLLLLATRLGEVARLVTGFTLAHSLTLALAVLDVVHPRGAAVEAVIAFSVALVAIEKAWTVTGRGRVLPIAVLAGLGALALASATGHASLPLLTVLGLLLFTVCYGVLVARHDGRWLRVCLTFAFGLVHGFGFAGLLMEMTLPTDRLVPALVGFNVGVELGQLGVVALLWPGLLLARRLADDRLGRLGAELCAAGLCGLGLFWMVERVL